MAQAQDEHRTLADELCNEMKRVRDDVLPFYIAIGSSGGFAAYRMREDLDAAAKALAEQDAIECLRSLKALRRWKE